MIEFVYRPVVVPHVRLLSSCSSSPPLVIPRGHLSFSYESRDSWRLISDLPVAGIRLPLSPSSRLSRRPRRLHLRIRLVRLVSSFRLEDFSFSLGLRRLSKICNNSRMGAAIVFVLFLRQDPHHPVLPHRPLFAHLVL